MGTNIDYSAVAHQTIFNNITQGPGIGPLMDAGRECQDIATELQAVQGLVEQAVRGIGVAQQGAAADAATYSATALVPWTTDAATAADRMAARISEQAASFAHTRDSMPPPRAVPDVSFSQDPGTWMADHAVEWLPGIQTEHERAQVAAQQDEQRAQELMNGYQGNSNDNLAIRAQFSPAPAVVAEVTDPTPVGGGGRGGTGDGSSHSGPAHAGSVAGGHGGAVAAEATASQPASSVAAVAAPVAISPQVAADYPDNGGQPIPGPSHLRPAPAAAAEFGAPPIVSPSGASEGGHRLQGGSRLTGGGTGGGRSASRGGGFGPRPSAAVSTGGSRWTDSRLRDSLLGDPRMGGSAPHGYLEEAGAGRGARSGADFAQAPLGATGGSDRGAGTEHRRPSYLIEQDTSAIVGELPRVAPPVIGADEDCR